MSMNFTGTELLLGAGDFLTIYLFAYMQRKFCVKREWTKNNEKLIIMIYFLDWIMVFTANMMEIPPLNFAAMLAAYLISLFLIYQVNSIRQLTGFLFYLVGIMLMEIVFGISAGYLNNEMGFHTQYELITPQTALLLVILNIAIFIILEKYTRLMHHEIDLAQEKNRLKSDADIMQLAAKLMKNRLRSAEAIMQKDRLMRHDRRHFEALLYQLLEEGRVEEAKKYLKERLSMESKGMHNYCENTTVNAVISHYISWAEKEGINTTISANVPSELIVDELELAITISNLIENAINACTKLPDADRYLKLTAKYKNQLLLEIENSCKDKVSLDEEGYPFSNEKNHGTGTRSVLAFVNKTNSEIYYLAEEKRFRVRMII